MLPFDDNILLSYVNTKLRNGATPDDLCGELGEAWETVEARLGRIGYVYEAESNRFRPV